MDILYSYKQETIGEKERQKFLYLGKKNMELLSWVTYSKWQQWQQYNYICEMLFLFILEPHKTPVQYLCIIYIAYILLYIFIYQLKPISLVTMYNSNQQQQTGKGISNYFFLLPKNALPNGSITSITWPTFCPLHTGTRFFSSLAKEQGAGNFPKEF